MWAKAITPGSTSDDGATAMPSARPTFHRALRATALLLAIWCVLAVLTQSGEASVATIFFSRDALWLLAFAVLLTGLSLFEHAPFVRMVAPPTIPVWSWRTAAILVLLVATFAMVGPRLVFHGHAFTPGRDDGAVRRRHLPLGALGGSHSRGMAPFRGRAGAAVHHADRRSRRLDLRLPAGQRRDPRGARSGVRPRRRERAPSGAGDRRRRRRGAAALARSPRRSLRRRPSAGDLARNSSSPPRRLSR